MTMIIKARFRLVRRGIRGGIFYCVDNNTGHRTSLHTSNEIEARQLIQAKNQALRQPGMNLQIARVYLQHGDPAMASRTWNDVMVQMLEGKSGNTLIRWQWAIRDKALKMLPDIKLIDTTPEHFLSVLRIGSVSTNVYLRRIHNYALNMHWLPCAVVPKANWPTVRHKEKRAITIEEHRKIVNRERNPATRSFYQLLWHLGGSQSDIATLTAEDINWKDRTISYRRKKTGSTSLISFGEEVGEILKELPNEGQLFPALARIHERHRAKLFIKRLKTVGVSGVSLHSYRYAWAERATAAGYPERFAMQALGHSSKAVHRAYAKRARVLIPSLEEYEKGNVSRPVAAEPADGVAKN